MSTLKDLLHIGQGWKPAVARLIVSAVFASLFIGVIVGFILETSTALMILAILVGIIAFVITMSILIWAFSEVFH